MTSVKKTRSSNIELLRILAICGVIALHYNYSPVSNAVSFTVPGSVNYWMLNFFEAVCVCGVNVFVLISGFFLIKNEKRSLWKPIELILQVILLNIGAYLVRIFLHMDCFSVGGFLNRLLPTNYYAVLYCVLYIISPLINYSIKVLFEKGLLKRSVVVLVLLFSIWTVAVDALQNYTSFNVSGLSSVSISGSGAGYTIVNFMLMYIIGAYISLAEVDVKKSRSLIAFWGSICLVFCWSICSYVGIGEIGKVEWNYNNPLVICTAVSAFLLFKKLSIPENRIINKLAKSTFTCFLLHSVFLGFVSHQVPLFAAGNPVRLLLHLIASCVGIYLICFIVYLIYDLIAGNIISAIRKRIGNLDEPYN